MQQCVTSALESLETSSPESIASDVPKSYKATSCLRIFWFELVAD